jgi:hypothetical protein
MFIASVVMTILSVTLSLFSVATVMSAPLAAGGVTVPNVVGFEGFLANASGQPLATSTYSTTFKVYDAPTGGNVLWTETKSVQVTNGLYAVTLGSPSNPIANVMSGNRWIGVTVSGGSEVSPRTQILSVPFAINADSANKVAGGTGMIALFENSCPGGWTEYQQARGRVVVGLPLNGTSGGTVGAPLNNLENRAHTHTGPSHTHTLASGSPSTFGQGPESLIYEYGTGMMSAASGGGSTVTYTQVSRTTTASGTGLTGPASTSNVIPYIQLV